MKLVLKIIGGVIALLLLAVLGLNLFLSASAVRERVAERVREQSGRELKVNGATSVLFLPKPHIVLSDVEISDPGHPAAPGLAIGRLSLDVSFGQLISRNVDAERVVMERPVLTLRLPSKSEGQEKHGQLEPTLRNFASAAPHFIAAKADGGPSPKREIRLNDVRIEDGSIRVLYGEGGEERRIEKINAALSLPRLADPLTAKGDFDWKGVRIGFDLKLATPADLKAERSARVDLNINAEAINAGFGGQVFSRPNFTGEGDILIKSHSIPSLIAWLRKEPPAMTTVGDGDVTSHVSWKEGEVSLTQTRFALSHAAGQGQAVLSLSGPKPNLRGAFAVESLDLTPFLASDGSTASAEQPSEAMPQIEAAPSPSQGGSPDWFRKPKSTEATPDGEHEAAPAGEPAGTGSLLPSGPPVLPTRFDAEINVNLAETKYQRLAVGPATLSLKLRDGVLDADLGSVQLYEGQGSGKLSIDGTKSVPSFSANFALKGVSAQPLLSAASGFNLISGLADAELQLKGEGSSAEEIKHSLSGGGSIDIGEGSIDGINLTELIASLGAGNIPDVNQGPGAKTTFTDLGASFSMASGVAETHDLEISSPLLEVKARGTVDMVTGTVDFLTHPKVVAGPKGRGGANDLAGLSIPVRVEGPFERPTFKPELGGMFGNADEAGRTVNQIGEMLQKKLKGKPVGEALGRFLGSVRIGTEHENSREEGGGRAEKGAPEAATPEAPQEEEEQPQDQEMEDILR